MNFFYAFAFLIGQALILNCKQHGNFDHYRTYFLVGAIWLPVTMGLILQLVPLGLRCPLH